MDIREAVSLAMAGEERGFGYLYENTYKSKYYLALQYMKNEEEAKDVLQEAYIKAFNHLDKLQNPDAFASWLGTIVANTAKNTLGKKNPMLFSDVAVDEAEENFEYQIEDENVDNQPEIAFTRKETQELVHELMDSLSPEQRICILMFHIEGASISEIADALNCSDNTVKSRLNYGRKNLKVKAEELQKKGYKLYSIAPLPLLLLLLRSDKTALSSDGTLAKAGKSMVNGIFRKIPLKNASAYTNAKAHTNTSGMSNGANAATKTGILHTIAGKIAAIAIGVCVTGGAIFYGVSQMKPKEEPVKQEEVNPVQQTIQTQEGTEPEEKEMADVDYPKLLAGNLTKEELTFVLAYGPEEIPEQGFQDSDYMNYLASLTCAKESPVENSGKDDQYRYAYSLMQLNRLFSSFSDYQFNEDNDSDTPYGTDVDGDTIWFAPPTLSWESAATITSASYTDTEMKVFFDFTKSSYERGTTNAKKVAILKPNTDGLYRITKIEIVADEATAGSTDETKTGSASVKDLYQGVLQSIQNQEAGYDFPNAGTLTGTYSYFLDDMDGDAIPELIVGAGIQIDVFEGYDCRVYSIENTGSGYQLKVIDGEISILGIHIPSDGNGLYKKDFSRGTGLTDIYRITIEAGALAVGGSAEQHFTMGDAQEEQFASANPAVEWRDISDLSGLDYIQ